MKDIDKQKKFIELRAKKWSYQRISDKIKVSKPTLIKWDRKFKYEINNLKNFELESLYEEFNLTKENRLEQYKSIQEKLIKEIKNRNLNDVKSDKLLEMILTASENIDNLKKPISFTTPEEAKEIEEERLRRKKFDDALKFY